jgi:hypothetical protein
MAGRQDNTAISYRYTVFDITQLYTYTYLLTTIYTGHNVYSATLRHVAVLVNPSPGSGNKTYLCQR